VQKSNKEKNPYKKRNKGTGGFKRRSKGRSVSYMLRRDFDFWQEVRRNSRD
jgi:hypothetical protein